MKDSHRGRDSSNSLLIGFISREIATSLNLSQEEIDEIYDAALIFETGGTPAEGPVSYPLDKKRKAGETENIGDSKAQEYVYYRQEHWDGSGFPEGLQKKEIPLGARILRLAEEYVRITQVESGATKKQEFQNLCSTVIDPGLAAHFLKTFDFETMKRIRGYEKRIEGASVPSLTSRVLENREDYELLRTSSTCLTVNYKNGRFLDEWEQETVVPMEESLRSILEGYRFSMENYQQYLEDEYTKNVYDVHLKSVQDGISIVMCDVTPLLDYERKQEEIIRKLYRDVVFSVTEGKLMIQEPHELVYGKGEELFDLPIQKSEDVKRAREILAETIASFFTKKEVYFLKLCLSEGTTNVLKHAENGRARAFKEDGRIRIVVSDNGAGIPLEDIPKAALYAGYSSSESLGQGYHLLLTFADRVLLSTDGDGTVLIIEKKLDDQSEQDSGPPGNKSYEQKEENDVFHNSPE
ncbi:HD domain-containing phosphohydrolase [Salimicrobium flavidum]|nr:HD domain-containing phosphohydrolase [Salimicrobium flavidum]